MVLREEPDLRHFLTSAIRYIHLHNDAIAVQLTTQEPTVTVSLQFSVDSGPLGRQAIELAVGVLFRGIQALIGRDWQPWSVCFGHGTPKSFEVHHRVFGSRVLFRQDLDGIMIRSVDLDRPVPSADPVMARYAHQYLDSLVKGGEEGMVDKVRHLATLLMPAGRCTIDQVAKYLGIDRRTIHRHLQRRELTFSDVVNSVRKDQVARYLAHGGRTLAETSDLLGFSGQSAFSRWFRQQFGCTAQAWREQRKAAG
jgi:excisionase family DNA binding protein